MLDQTLLSEYNKTRVSKNVETFCHAPFTNMNFDQSGNATVCCYNRTHILGTYPNNSLRDMWFGDKAEQLRRDMRKNDLPPGCNICYDQFQSKNFRGLRARGFDLLADKVYPMDKGKYASMPKVLEFEISNICNLECTMCSGHFSSLIRKNREKLPPLVNPYDDLFVEQFAEFIPHLQEARFLGGEPFLIKLYYKLWELIAQLNPDCQVKITTNGTILNNKVKDILEKLNAHILISIDSLDKQNYERIRTNARFDQVMENSQFFRKYVTRKKTSMSLLVCAMQQNWQEGPDFLDFCNSHEIELYFNTVVYPENASLKTLGYKKLCQVVDFLERKKLTSESDLHKHNNSVYQDLVQQVNFYKNSAQDAPMADVSEKTHSPKLEVFAWLTRKVKTQLQMLTQAEDSFEVFLHRLQLIRLRFDRLRSRILGPLARPRVLATACWSFPDSSQTFVYQQLTQLISNNFKVRFLYTKLNSRKEIPTQYRRLWYARRRLVLHSQVCDRDYTYFKRLMPEKVSKLTKVLSEASGMSTQEIENHHHFLQAFAFARVVEAYRPDYLHSYFFYEGSLFAFIASYLLDIPRGISCYTDHMLKDYSLKVVRLHLENCNIVIANSEQIKEELLSFTPQVNPERIIVSPVTINAALFPARNTEDPINGEPYRIISHSSIESKNGLLYLAEAVALLRKRSLNIEWHHIGSVDGSPASREYSEKLQTRIKNLKLADIVHLEGEQSEDSIKPFFHQAHLFVAPFVELEVGDKDEIPTSLLEGMASGLPVVASDAGSMSEVIEDGLDGVIVPQGDSNVLAGAIADLLSDVERRASLGKNAARKVREKFDVTLAEHQFHNHLSKFLSENLDNRERFHK